MMDTAQTNEKGIGYASSQDLIHWSEQQYIPVMNHDRQNNYNFLSHGYVII